MINKNFRLSSDRKVETKPFLLRPVGKDYLWGGRKLKDDFGKEINISPLAETWECSTHPDGTSQVANGEFCGWSLTEVLKLHPEFLGRHSKTSGELPILIKLIDAREDLSVQVHPSDDYANKYENGQMGKTEMWYILEAAKEAHLVMGLHHEISRETLYNSIFEGTVEKYLQRVKVKKDDVYYIEAGTIHAVGAGILLAEIQECSNLTYRLYDYERIDKNGNKRELHIDKALDVASLKGSAEPLQPMRVLKYFPGRASELLCRCKYFEVYRMLINTERHSDMVNYETGSDSFHVLLCIGGCGTVYMEDGESICFFKGDCFFFPADSVKVRLHGKAQFLDVRV